MEDNKIEVSTISSNNKIKNINNTSIKKGNFFMNLIGKTTMQTVKNEPKNQEEINTGTNNENDNFSTNKKTSFITKILKNKQAKVAIVVLIFSFCALFILNSSFGTNSVSGNQAKKNENFTSGLEYCEQLETKLKNVLSKISGAGNVSVMVSVKEAPELIIASSSNEKTNSNSTANGSQTNSTITKDPVIVTNSGISSPLILTEKLPEVTGVVVVAEGAKDIKVRLSLLQAVQALLNVDDSNIQIYY